MSRTAVEQFRSACLIVAKDNFGLNVPRSRREESDKSSKKKVEPTSVPIAHIAVEQDDRDDSGVRLRHDPAQWIFVRLGNSDFGFKLAYRGGLGDQLENAATAAHEGLRPVLLQL